MKCNSIQTDCLYVLTNTNGEKFLGYSACLVNPCGDYYDPHDYVGGYVREGTDDLILEKEIVSAVKIEPFDCYYWDVQKKEYSLLVNVCPKSISTEYDVEERQRNASLLQLAASSEERETYIKWITTNKKCLAIRSWLLIYAKCTNSVFVDSDFAINSNGSISIECGDNNIPSYVNDGLKRGRQNLSAEVIILYAQIKQAKADILQYKERLSVEDNPDELKKINRRINELESSLKPLKEEIAFKKCIDKEFTYAHSGKEIL